jgi:hypothetical protein
VEDAKNNMAQTQVECTGMINDEIAVQVLDVGCRLNQKERLFLEEKHARGKRQLEGKEARAREAGEAHMHGRPNNARVRVFVMHCNGW